MIEVHGICKTFKTPRVKEGHFSGLRALVSRDYLMKEAVRNISFTVEPGEFTGYIGPNGAGKSTTIKMLTGILRPSAGQVRILGLDPHRERKKAVARIGVVFGQRSQLWWDLPVRDSYDILAAMYKVEPAEKTKRMAEFRELLELDDFLETPVRKLSLGQRMRAELAAALIHDPDILFLDEPTIGLDVTAKNRIRGFLQTLNQDFGKTILLTTHDMDDIERLCSRVMVIQNGELSFDGTIPQMRDRIGLPSVMKVTFRDDGNLAAKESPVPEDGGLFRVTGRSGCSLTVEFNRLTVKAMEVLHALHAWGEIEDVHMVEPVLEDYIGKVYGAYPTASSM
ncbi:ABC transporter ATP-binding protein [Gorillibacterium massiliense]|uniref:ABC transporter ATP-binding protein n=1 Tax=Gorillibacterium massiliense TaxID=1280390 RepID=UPI0004AF6DC0|nr:ATP-binding cassette domain-containing protein [Gorillibacterium massiliense]